MAKSPPRRTESQEPFEPEHVNTAPVASEVSARSGRKVVVACKLPMGMMLEIDVPYEVREQTPTGPITLKMWRKLPGAVRVHGSRVRFGEQAEYPIVGGYALTDNVDADVWDKWLEQNKDQPYVTNKLIFAYPTMDGAKGSSRENKAVLSGFEPLNPARRHVPGTDRTEPVDPRWPRRSQFQAGTITEVGEADRTEA